MATMVSKGSGARSSIRSTPDMAVRSRRGDKEKVVTKGDKKKAKTVKFRNTKFYCMDCVVRIGAGLTGYIEMTKFKLKNPLFRIWNGFKFLFG